MKFARIWSGIMAVALVATSLPISGLAVSADQGAVGAQHGIESSGYVYQRLTSNPETWTVSTDAGSGADTDITNILKDDDKWISADAVVSTTAADQQAGHPVKDITLERNNNFYLKLNNPADVGRLVYYCSTGHKNGKILKANVYVSTDSSDVSTVDELKKLDWGEPVAADSNKQECSGTGFGQTKAVEYKFNEVKQGVKYVRMEALETCGEEWQALPNTLICCFEMELYSDSTTPLADAAEKKISADNMRAYADFDTHRGNNQNVTKILDGAGTTGQFRVDFTDDKVCCSMEANNSAEFNQDTYLNYPLQKGFVKNNNIFMTLDEPQNLAMLTYVPADIVGSILDARIYLSNKDDVTDAKDIGTAEENIKGDATTDKETKDWTQKLSEGWVKVYDGEEQWARWNANPQSNNGHSVYWDPMTAKHVRIEVEHTYNSAATSASLTRNTKINAKRILLYKGVKSVDVTPRDEESVTKIVAFSGYLSEQDKTDHSVDHMFDDKEEDGHNHDTAWVAGPALKGNKSNMTDVPYIVLDLGENTRTIVDAVTILWGDKNDAESGYQQPYAARYAVLTTDKLNPELDIQTNINPGEENHWSDKTLKNPPKLDGSGRNFTDLKYDEDIWTLVREEDNTKTDDSVSFDGAMPDNAYFDTEKCEEVKRYICLVMLDMNQNATSDGVAVRCASIMGARRTVEPIAEATVNMTKPVAGEKPVAPERTSTDFTITDVKWTKDGMETPVGDTFPEEADFENHAYTVSATLKPDFSKIFTENTEIVHDGIADGRDHIHMQAMNPDGTMSIAHTFLKEVTSATVSVTLPNAGENIEDAVSPSSAEPDKYLVEKFEWKKIDEDAAVSDGKFETGTNYQLLVTLAATDKYYFAAESGMTATIAGQEAVITENDDGRKLTATVNWTAKDVMSKVAPKVIAPKAGEMAAQVEAETEAGYEVESTKWENDSSEELSIGNQFLADTAYTVEAVLRPKDDNHKFAEADAIDAWLTDSGNESIRYEARTEPTEDGKIKVIYDFMAESEMFKEVAKSLLQTELDKYSGKEKSDYTTASWEPYETEYQYANARKDEAGINELYGLTSSLEDYENALKRKIPKLPALSMDAPTYKGALPELVMAEDDSTGIEKVERKWYRVEESKNYAMSNDEKFGGGQYKMDVRVIPAEGYGFEDSSLLTNVALNGGDSSTQTFEDKEITTAGYLKGSCTFDVEIPCTCAIGDISMTVEGAPYADSMTIELEKSGSTSKTLRAKAAVAACEKPDHAKTVPTFKYEVTQGVGASITGSANNELSVTKAGNVTVKVTATIHDGDGDEQTEEKEFYFEVLDDDAALEKLQNAVANAKQTANAADAESKYTEESLNDLKNAINEADKVKDATDRSKIDAAAQALAKAVEGLRQKIASPQITVIKPNAGQKAADVGVTSSDTAPKYTINDVKWWKIVAGEWSEMNENDTFDGGKYAVSGTLNPAVGYAFEESTKPTSVTVKDGEELLVQNLDYAEISHEAVTFGYVFNVDVECTCQVGTVTASLSGEGVTGASIAMGVDESKTVTLTATAEVTGCKDPEHANRELEYSFAKKKDDDNIISKIEQVNGEWQMTVVKAGTATITATAAVKGDATKTSTGDLEFTVTKEAVSIDPEAPAGSEFIEQLKSELSDAEKLGKGNTENYTDKTLAALAAAIKQAEEATAEGGNPTNGAVWDAMYALGDAVEAVEQEEEYANLKKNIEALVEEDYTEASWSALQTALQTAQSGVTALQNQWTAANSELSIHDYGQELAGLVSALKSAKDALVKEGEVECNCTISDIEVKVDGTVTTGIAIGDADTKEVELTAEAAVTCQDPAHANRTLTYKFAEKANADGVISKLEQVDGKWKMTVVKAGTATVTVTATIVEDTTKTKQRDVTFTVTKDNTPVNPPVDPEIEEAEKALQKALKDMQDILGAGQSNYSDETWEAFRQAYLKARDHAPGMTAEELKNLLRELNEAKAALAENKQPTDEKKPQPNQGGQKPPTGDNLPKAGTQYTVGKLVYQVKTSTATDKTVMVMNATSKTQKKITIPATVMIGGQAYKVVEIKANAFAKNKKLTTVKIGKNVTKIGKKAFFGCAKLKKVTIKATGLKTIGKQAFAKINKKARIRVPKKQLKTLKKKLKKAKTIKSAKITK